MKIRNPECSQGERRNIEMRKNSANHNDQKIKLNLTLAKLAACFCHSVIKILNLFRISEFDIRIFSSFVFRN